MPKKMLPTVADFESFKKDIQLLGFKQIGKTQFQNDLYRLKLEAPRPKNGREVGFDYFANNLRVVVWTTFVEDAGEARAEDSGWVLITKNDTSLYFAHPMRRTKNFFKNLYSYAKACMERIANRPICKDVHCRRMFDIVEVKKTGGRYWACSNTAHHGGKPPRVSWDHGLSVESLAFMKVERAEKKRYRDKRSENWQSVGMARKTRKKWQVGMPQNKQ